MLNRELFANILTWAVQDYRHKEGLDLPDQGFLDKWGHWAQNYWSRIQTGRNVGDITEDNMCGSSFCIAGQAAAQSGDRLMIIDTGALTADRTVSRDAFPSLPRKRIYVRDQDVPEDADVEDVAVTAKDVLGLHDDGPLFQGDNSIWRVVSFGVGLAFHQEGAVLDLDDYVLDYLDEAVLRELRDVYYRNLDVEAVMEAYNVVQV